MAGKKAFLAFAHEDAFRVPALIAALDAWELAFAVLAPTQQPPDALTPDTVQQIRACEVYIRLCTGMTRSSPQVALADKIFQEQLDSDRKHGRQGKHRLVNVILDAAYPIDQHDKATLYIDTTNKTRALWLEDLAVPLGVATLKQRISRRALVGMGVGAALTVLSGGTVATILVEQHQQQTLANDVIPNTKGLSGQPRWTIELGAFGDQSNAATDLYFVNGAYYATVYGQSSAGTYAVATAHQTARLVPIVLDASANIQGLTVAGNFITIVYFDQSGNSQVGIFALTGGPQLFALNAQTVGPLTVVDGTIFSQTADAAGNSFVSAFSAHDGSLVWQKPIDVTDPVGLSQSDWLTVANGAVFVSAYDHTLTCFDAKTGAQRWRFVARSQLTAATIVGGVAYAGARDGAIYAVDVASGQQRWSAQAVEGITAAPIINNGILVIGSLNGYLYAFDAKTGKLYWRSILGDVNTNTTPFTITSQPVVYRNVVAVTSQGVVFSFDLRNGDYRWQFTPIAQSSDDLSQLYIDSSLDNGLILCGAPDGKIFAINP